MMFNVKAKCYFKYWVIVCSCFSCSDLLSHCTTVHTLMKPFVFSTVCDGHPRVKPEPAGILSLRLLQDRLQPVRLQSLNWSFCWVLIKLCPPLHPSWLSPRCRVRPSAASNDDAACSFLLVKSKLVPLLPPRDKNTHKTFKYYFCLQFIVQGPHK